MRMRIIGREWDLCNKLKGLKSSEPGEDWKITYATPVYGGWDAIIECCFSKLSDLDKIVTYCRVDEELSAWIEDTTTLTGTRPDFPE